MGFPRFLLSGIFSFTILFALSQQQFTPLNREYNLWLDRHLNNKENFSHTTFKPWLESAINPDSLEISDSLRGKNHEYKRWIGRKLKTESLIVVDSGEFFLTIDPLFNFQYSYDFADTSLRADTVRFINNTRGVIIRANFGSNVSVTTSFLENQSYFPAYIDDFVKSYDVVPGSGRVKPFKKTGYDYALASGYVSYSPLKNLNFQLGHDKNFIGEGYRSLLLSDNAFNYPFLKITSSFFNNRLQYTNLYAQLSGLERIPAATTPEALFKPKAGTFHYLSIIPWKHLHIGFFEGILWQRWDSTGSLQFDPNFINPVIFANTTLMGLNGKNNAVIGANLKLKILKGLALYSQIVYDADKNYGYQAGLKSFDLFRLKNLNFQIEYNNVTAKTYSHAIALQNYSHYNQSLAHPLNQNFYEVISIFNYNWRDFFVQLKINYSEAGFKTILFQDYTLGYLINRETCMNLFCKWTNRKQTVNNYTFITGIPTDHSSQLISIGIRTSLSNQYLDF